MIRLLPGKALLVLLMSSFLWLPAVPRASAQDGQAAIVALVNDEPISNHDVDMRLKLALSNSPEIKEALQARLKEQRTQDLWRDLVTKHRPTSKEEAQKLQLQLFKQLQSEIVAGKRKTMRKDVLNELIDERLQMQQAAKLGVALSEEELDEQLDAIASRNKDPKSGKPLGRAEFTKALEKMGIPMPEFRNRMKARSSWVRVVRRKFQYQVNIGDQDVDRMIVAEDDSSGTIQTIYTLQRVSIPVDFTDSEATKAEAFARAEVMRQSVSSCAQLADAANQVSGAEVKSLGNKPAESLPQTMRVYLSRMSDGQLSPPTLTSAGVELYAICGRKQRKMADLAKRDEVKEKLRAQEFEVLARRFLQDLRQEASIEYKQN